MATCRDVTTEALRALGALAPGDSAEADESDAAMDALSVLIHEWHESRGPMIDVDISADYTPGENQRVRVQNGVTVSITLPNSVNFTRTGVLYDYGFWPSTIIPVVGSIAVADGVTLRAPRDGARIEIVGLTQALYFYRADLNLWVSVLDLTLDSDFPLNERYRGHFGALVAQRLIDSWPALYEPTPNLSRRIARANHIMLTRPGVVRDPVVADYI